MCAGQAGSLPASSKAFTELCLCYVGQDAHNNLDEWRRTPRWYRLSQIKNIKAQRNEGHADTASEMSAFQCCIVPNNYCYQWQAPNFLRGRVVQGGAPAKESHDTFIVKRREFTFLVL